jgi:uncharacterized membrane protein YqjE
VAPQVAENEQSVAAALERVLNASQRIVQDRTDLVFLEVRQLVGTTFEGLLALGLAVGLLMLAWVATISMLVFLLSEVMPRSAALAAVAAVNLAGGLVLLRVAMSKAAFPGSGTVNRRGSEIRGS